MISQISLFGTAIALELIQEYLEHPEWFPQGIDSLENLAARRAETQLALACAQVPTEAEKTMTRVVAQRIVSLAVLMAKRYSQQGKA